MDFNLDPEPFTFNSFEGFASFSNDDDENNTSNTNNESLSDESYITADIHFIPAISIKPIPKKTCLLNEHSYNIWKPTIQNIIIQNNTIEVYENNTLLFKDAYDILPRLKTLFHSDIKPSHIRIHVPYSIIPHKSITNHGDKIPHSLSLENSLGETNTIKQIFTNKTPNSNITPSNSIRNFTSERNILSRLLRTPRNRTAPQSFQVSHQMQILSQTLQTLMNSGNEEEEETLPDNDSILNDRIQQLTNMGFPNIEYNREALIRARGDINLAIEFLLQTT